MMPELMWIIEGLYKKAWDNLMMAREQRATIGRYMKGRKKEGPFISVYAKQLYLICKMFENVAMQFDAFANLRDIVDETIQKHSLHNPRLSSSGASRAALRIEVASQFRCALR